MLKICLENLKEMMEARWTPSGWMQEPAGNKQTESPEMATAKRRCKRIRETKSLYLAIERANMSLSVVKKHQKNLGIEEQIVAMYSKGMTVRDIQDHLNRIYGVDVSPTLISNITNKLMPMIKEWQNRPLESIYAAVFLDAIHYKVRQEGAIVNKAAYMVIGIDLEGRKDVLGMWIGEHETSKFWLVVLNELRNRGVRII